jgi:hypothetical protein
MFGFIVLFVILWISIVYEEGDNITLYEDIFITLCYIHHKKFGYVFRNIYKEFNDISYYLQHWNFGL